MPIPAKDFVAAVMRKLNASGPTELARQLGLGHHAPRRIANWLKGDNEPDYQATMLMLEATGWLNMNARARRRRKQTAIEQIEETLMLLESDPHLDPGEVREARELAAVVRHLASLNLRLADRLEGALDERREPPA